MKRLHEELTNEREKREGVILTYLVKLNHDWFESGRFFELFWDDRPYSLRGDRTSSKTHGIQGRTVRWKQGVKSGVGVFQVTLESCGSEIHKLRAINKLSLSSNEIHFFSRREYLRFKS